MKWLIDALDPTRKQQMEAKERAKKLLKSIGVSPDIKLTTHEMMVSYNFLIFSYISIKQPSSKELKYFAVEINI